MKKQCQYSTRFGNRRCPQDATHETRAFGNLCDDHYRVHTMHNKEQA